MRILFTLLYLPEEPLDKANGMYIDLAKACVNSGHTVTIIGGSLVKTRLTNEGNIDVLRVKSRRFIGEPNLIKKGIAMASLPFYFKHAYSYYFSNRELDWIVMPTPPITLIDLVKTIKRFSKAKLYLLLRDIHPQSSWSLGEIKYKWMYTYLNKRSKSSYGLADLIGCMSQKNIDYILDEYPTLNPSKFRVLYNWLEPSRETEISVDIRSKYSLAGKVIALFGGNIGLGQRIENIIDLAEHYSSNPKVMFVVIGKGVKKPDLYNAVQEKNLSNVLFLDYMPQDEYLNFIRNVDIGLISINENNAAPTCPSKLASYMSMKIPVLAMINKNNDYGQMIDSAGAGFWAIGSDKNKVYEGFDALMYDSELRRRMGNNGYDFFLNHMTTEIACDTMLSQMNEIK